jgi:cation diffusion facilitator family transporter
MDRDLRVRRVLLIEGLANVFVLMLKVVVGVATGSLAVLSDAAHSLSDVANNVVAWFILRLSAKPPDTEHPYGHRKFETLAVFALATLLTVVAVELALSAFRRQAATIESEPWALALMGVVLLINISVTAWENLMARRLESDILAADARHTFADIATTLVVIAGWQLAARGYPWIDNLCALGVALLILFLAYGLFRRAIPILVDHAAIDSDTIMHLACSVEEVRDVGHIRSRSIGSQIAVDMVIRVAPDLTTAVSHAIADEVESRVLALPNVVDVTVHVEPM